MVFLFKLLHGACLRKKLLLAIVTLFHQMQFNLKCRELEYQSQQVMTICLRFTSMCVFLFPSYWVLMVWWVVLNFTPKLRECT